MFISDEEKSKIVEKSINDILEKIWLSSKEQVNVREYLYHCLDQALEYDDYTYNVLVECYDKNKGKILAKELAGACYSFFKQNSQAIDCHFFEGTEENFISYFRSERRKDIPTVAIINEMCSETPEDWDIIYENLKKVKNILKIYVKSYDESISRINEDSYFRWRFLTQHISKSEMDTKNALECFLYRLKGLNVTYDDGFAKGIENHISTVYPGKLSDEEFVDDLIDSVKAKSSQHGGRFTQLTVFDVPSDREHPNPAESVKETGGSEVLTSMEVSVENNNSEIEKVAECSKTEELIKDTENDKREEKTSPVCLPPKPKKKNVNTSKTNNILMLALSDYKVVNEKPSVFEYKKNESDNESIFRDDDCRYQLEPVTKYMLQECQGQKVTIIELTTAETLRINKSVDSAIKISAKDHFEERINEYNDNEQLGCDITYISIDIDENDIEPGIVNSISKLIEITKGGYNQFWIDTHGSFREISLVMSSIISLLKFEMININPTQIFGVHFTQGRNKPDSKSKNNTGNEQKQDEQKQSEQNDAIQKIVDQRKSYHVTDFVSGMNEFFEYGSANILEKYYENETNIHIKNVVDAIKKVSDGTKLCDPNLYIKALDELGTAIKEYNPINMANKAHYFDIFVEYIKKNYGNLLDKNRRKNIDIISRCLKHGMYQQALTFIESLMPEDFVAAKMVWFDGDQKQKIADAKKKAKKEYVSDAHFAFEEIMRIHRKTYSIGSELNKIQISPQDRDDYLANYIIRSVSDSSIKICHDWKFSEDGKCDKQYEDKQSRDKQSRDKQHEEKDNNKSYKITFRTNVGEENKSYAGKLIRLHWALKQVRNLANHSKESESRPDISQISEAINEYIRLSKIILENKKATSENECEKKENKLTSTIMIPDEVLMKCNNS